MGRLETRLRKLEARLTDRSRLVPRTQGWLEYWTVRLDALVNGGRVEEMIPIEFLDALIAGADATGNQEAISGAG
jgi:hypothetical protein